ncbi:MAG: MFS transporter [Dehalococcoidia bacterium]|nr:MFS transporter [Dehalococcoidia bacterium]
MDTAAPQSFHALPKHKIVFTMVGVLLAMFMGSLDQTIVDTAMPRIVADLSGFEHYTWIITVYIIASAIAVPIVGKLTDMFGRKPFYLGGIIIFTIASIFSGLSRNMPELIIFRGIQGLGAGAMMANAFIVISDIFPPSERGKYQGLISGVFGMSAIIGPTLGGLITDRLSWHWIFYVNVPLGIIIIILFTFFFPYIRPNAKRGKIDFPGMVTLSLGVMSLLLALSWAGGQYPWLSFPVIGLLSHFVLMLLAFLYIESHSSNPLIPLSLFRNRIIYIAEIVVFMTAIGMFAAIIFVPLFFQGVLGATATISGGFLTPMMLGQVTGSFTSGQLLSRTGGHYRMQGFMGLLIMCVGVFLLTRMSPSTGYGIAVVNIVLTGFGLGMTMPLYTIAVQNAAPYRMLGVATSTVPFIRSIGASMGLAIFNPILNSQFASHFTSGLPQAVKDILPAEQIEGLTRNPQLLMNAETEAGIKEVLMHASPQGEQLFEQLQQSVREALSSAIHHIFIIAFVAVIIAVLVHFFIKEIPLRKDHGSG